MATAKPIRLSGGKKKEFATTDTISPNHLAPSGADGDVLVKDSTLPDGKKWQAATNSTQTKAAAYFIS